jgi:hypothetical protein
MNRREWMASVAGMAIGSRVQPDKRMSRFRSTCNKAREYAKLLGPSVGPTATCAFRSPGSCVDGMGDIPAWGDRCAGASCGVFLSRVSGGWPLRAINRTA